MHDELTVPAEEIQLLEDLCFKAYAINKNFIMRMKQKNVRFILDAENRAPKDTS